MLLEQWEKLPSIWKKIILKEWLLFKKCKFPLSVFLGDDSYGLNFLLCKALGIDSSEPEKDLKQLEDIISTGLKKIDENTIYEIFSMQFLYIPSEISTVSTTFKYPVPSINPQIFVTNIYVLYMLLIQRFSYLITY